MSHFLFHLFVISFDVCIDILKNLFVKDKMASNKYIEEIEDDFKKTIVASVVKANVMLEDWMLSKVIDAEKIILLEFRS